MFICRLWLWKNELFINNGDLTFTESSKIYGLDNEGLSTHAAFFDFDNDGKHEILVSFQGEPESFTIHHEVWNPATGEWEYNTEEIPNEHRKFVALLYISIIKILFCVFFYLTINM